MNHVLAILALAAACVAWLVVQRWAGTDTALPCGRHGEGCGACGEPGDSCSRETDPQ